MEGALRATGRVLAWLAAGIAVLAVGLYAVNSIRHNEPTLRGDQWFWVTNVLVPVEDGRMSLWDAITFEYQSFAHSHVPTLTVFLVNDAWFGLTPTIDTIVGFLSLGVVTFLAWRHLDAVPLELRIVAIATIAGSVFVSSDPSNFVWSLLQFQMFYVLVAFVYLLVIGRRITDPPALLALAIPAAMVLGDAIGAAAVASSLLYLTLLVLLRRTPWRAAIPYYASFLVSLLALGPLLRGQRQHGGGSWLDFVDYLRSEPWDVTKAFYYALAQAVVAFHRNVDGPGFLRWDAAWLWIALTVALVAIAVLGFRRAGLEPTDHLPIMLMGASLIWTLGVIRARSLLFGPQAIQAPRYAAYTVIVGIGLVLLVTGKLRQFGRPTQVAVAGLFVVALAANTVGSLATTADDQGEQVQASELERIRRYVETPSTEPPLLGLACSHWSPCLEGAWYLWDRKLGPFADDTEERPAWLRGFRTSVYQRWHEADVDGKEALCSMTADATEADWLADLTDPAGLAPFLAANDASVPAGEEATAAAVTAKAMVVKCESFRRQREAGFIS